MPRKNQTQPTSQYFQGKKVPGVRKTHPTRQQLVKLGIAKK